MGYLTDNCCGGVACMSDLSCGVDQQAARGAA
jgi:hypothetical protein